LKLAKSQPNLYRYLIFYGLLAVSILIVGYITCRYLIYQMDKDIEVSTIDCGANREIVITAASSWEVLQPFYYLVRIDGKVVVPRTYFGDNYPPNDPTTIRFTKHISTDGNLVGITYADKPSQYLIIHDFSNNQSYPSDDLSKWNKSLSDHDNRQQHEHIKAELINRLNQSGK
jgi:hypothetical protein